MIDFKKIAYCPGTLESNHDSYSSLCLRKMFENKSVSHILPYSSPKPDEEDYDKFIDNRKRISISGVQEKMSLILDKNKLRLTNDEEQGTYILKPIPRDLKNVGQVPANEHLTMQIAHQVYGINTAENALIFFKDGESAYITKRFDVKKDGSKWGKEDFASLVGKTEENAGSSFKYDYSYEEMAEIMKKYVAAYFIEIEKFFRLIVFNYIFSNGDAHLKNFSLLESQNGDYLLSPAYDLINTRIHVDDSDIALNRGLFKGDKKTTLELRSYHPNKEDFIELARRMQISESRTNKIMEPFLVKQPKVDLLLKNSFLNEKTKHAYKLHYNEKMNYFLK